MGGHKKYSDLLVAEAVSIYEKISMKEAVRLTGVHKKTIEKAWRLVRVARGIPPNWTACKYTVQQKIDCINLAMKYLNMGYMKSEEKAFLQAGRVMNINGRSIWNQYRSKNVYGFGDNDWASIVARAQQPGTSPAGASGSSIQAASPHAQRCAEHHPAPSVSLPEPKIIRRRRYTSDMIPAGVLKGHKPQV